MPNDRAPGTDAPGPIRAGGACGGVGLCHSRRKEAKYNEDGTDIFHMLLLL
jgi:hypothetical protein